MLNAPSFTDLDAFVEDDDDVERDTWHVLMAPNDVRVFSLEQLDDTYRLGLIDERTMVWRPSLVEWTELERVIGDTEPAPPDLWHVLMAPNRVVDATLDQLDNAFQRGVIDERTLVWRTGLPGWTSLGVVAGIESEPRPVPVSAPSASVPSSVAPLAFSLPPPVEAKSKAERWLFGAALVAASALVLYRNDLVYQAAEAVGQAPYVDRAEQRAFGGPVFGTPRRAQELIVQQHIDRARISIPAMLADQQRAAERDAAQQHLLQEQADRVAAAKRKADEADTARKKADEERRLQAQRAEQAERARTAAQSNPSPAHAAPATRNAQKSNTGKGDLIPGVKASSARRGSEYDPLNPTL